MAYSNAARTIEILEEDVGALVREGRFKKMRGMGEALARHTAELVITGRLQLYIPERNDSKSNQSCKKPVCDHSGPSHRLASFGQRTLYHRHETDH